MMGLSTSPQIGKIPNGTPPIGGHGLSSLSLLTKVAMAYQDTGCKYKTDLRMNTSEWYGFWHGVSSDVLKTYKKVNKMAVRILSKLVRKTIPKQSNIDNK